MAEHVNITPEVFDQLLRLSQLSLEKDETDVIERQVNDIVESFGVLRKFDIPVDSCSFGSGHTVEDLRSDTIKTGIEQTDLKQLTPEYMDGYFRVPKVLESGV